MTPLSLKAQIFEFEALEGWEADDHLAALNSFIVSCERLDGAEWGPICGIAPTAAKTDTSAKAFFELFFKPIMIGTPPALFTGYYEPVLEGSATRTPRYAYPIYSRPPELRDGEVFLSRAQIEAGALRGRGLEIAWLDDPTEAFFLQIQGSGRINMTDGRVLRVGYAGRNGFGYQSVGREMIRRGTHSESEVSAQAIKNWVRQTGSAGQDLLNTNPSYVFFRVIPALAPSDGPIGAMGRSITAMRSVAVDPDFVPLGAPVWIEKDGEYPLRSLMIAQDTGGAIKGAQRADIFFGTGDAAGQTAGTIKDAGRMLVLLPIDRAYAMLPEG
jgi:membrane-bound lytic murein transglycosylase A